MIETRRLKNVVIFVQFSISILYINVASMTMGTQNWCTSSEVKIFKITKKDSF